MTTTTKLCLFAAALFSTQFTSCKKDNLDIVTPLNAESKENAMADSTTDSSLLKGLVAWYTFNGDVLDHSGNNNNVIFNSAKPAKGKSGILKTAYVFDGVSSYMEIANSKSLNPLKIPLHAIVKPTGFYQGVCHSNRILSKSSNDYDNGKIALGYDDQLYYGYDGCHQPVQSKFQNFYGTYGDGANAAGVNDLNNYLKLNQWYDVVYTFDGTYSKIYLNGALVSKVQGYTTFTPNSSPLLIGKTSNPEYPYRLKGVVDEIRIYKRALTAREVLKLYNLNN